MRTRQVAALVFSLSVLLSATSAGVGMASAGTGAVGFSEGKLTEERGDVATIGVELVETDDASLLIQSAQQDYSATLWVRDGNGDGRVHVRFNTFYGVNSGDGTAFETAAENDTVVVLQQSTDQSLPVLESGRYNLIASVGDSRIASVLQLEEGSITSRHTTAVAPDTAGSFSPTGDTDARSTDEESNVSISTAAEQPQTEIAEGDVARTKFEISGIEGALQETVPAERLVFANDSTPGVETTHLVQVSPDRNLTNVRSVSVNYRSSYGDTPPVYQGDLDTFGLDTDGDGRIDRSLKIAVASVRTSTDGQRTVYLDRSISIDSGDTLLAEYAVTNPDMTGKADVRVELGSDYEKTGSVMYGLAGSGTLGHGIDLRIRNVDGGDRIVAPLAPLAVEYDSTEKCLHAIVDSADLESGSYEVNLEVRDHPELPWTQTSMRERIAVVPPSVTLAGPTWSPDSESFDVEADTNLAPGNRVIVQAELAEQRTVYLARGVGIVNQNGTISVDFELPDSVSASTLTVSVTRNNTTLAGPTDYEVPV